jgi:hypothetical protein
VLFVGLVRRFLLNNIFCLRLCKHLKLLKSVTGRGIGGKEAESVASAPPVLPPKRPLNTEGTNYKEHEYNEASRARREHADGEPGTTQQTTFEHHTGCHRIPLECTGSSTGAC